MLEPLGRGSNTRQGEVEGGQAPIRASGCFAEGKGATGLPRPQRSGAVLNEQRGARLVEKWPKNEGSGCRPNVITLKDV